MIPRKGTNLWENDEVDKPEAMLKGLHFQIRDQSATGSPHFGKTSDYLDDHFDCRMMQLRMRKNNSINPPLSKLISFESCSVLCF